MAATVDVITKPLSKALSVRWIISARDDLLWFIGSVVSSYALLLLYVKGLLPLVPMIAVWAVCIDAPHVFGTYSRTYFDRSERLNRPRLLWGSLIFFMVGPLMVFLGAGLFFFFVAALWAYYHLVKQHYGFMVLYKKKNGDLASLDNTLDKLLLIFAFNYPFVAFIAGDNEAMARVPGILHPGVNIVAGTLLIGTIVVAVVWLGRQIQRATTGEPLDIPKYLLLAAAIPMHWIVLLTPMPHKPIALVAILTIYHNLQYHRLIWFHNKKYTSTALTSVARSRETFGAATFISNSLFRYVLLGILFGVFYQGPRQLLGYLTLKSGVATEPSFSTQLAVSFLWGFAFIHYYLDSKIWRVRRDPAVGRALHIQDEQA